MAGSNLSDTNEKIVMKDHDILIAVHTLQTELIRRFDEYIKSNDARHQQNEKEMGQIAKAQIRLDGDIINIKGMISNLDERIDKQEIKSFRMDAAGYVAVIIAGAIAWFKS